MRQSGEHRIPAPRAEVWRALNDPAVLARCLEGCRSMRALGDGAFVADVRAKVGPVRAGFTADIALSDVVPLESYRLDVRVKGGVAGFARGTANVRLDELDGGAATGLRYEIEGAIGGKLAQIGSRLVEGAARKMTASFFDRFVADFAATRAREQ